jgi:hypothetical protein
MCPYVHFAHLILQLGIPILTTLIHYFPTLWLSRVFLFPIVLQTW